MAEQVRSEYEPREALFRGAALKRFSSPERLDQRIHLIPPAMRVMAASATVIVAAGLIWAIFGSVPTRVIGQGVLLADGKPSHAVQPIVSGLVSDLLVKRGQPVEVGTMIARIEQVTLDTRLASATARVAALERDLVLLKKAHAAELARSDASYHRQVMATEERIKAGNVRAVGLKDILTSNETLFAKGLVSRLEVAVARAQHDQTMLDIATANARKIELEAASAQKHDDLAEIERRRQEEIDALQAEVARLGAEVGIGSVAKAPVAGVVEEIRVGRGDVVSPGTILATIGQTAPRSFEVIALFSNDMAKRVAPGMDVHVRPFSVRKEEHGTMRGRVRTITELGVSKAEVNAILRNPELTDSLVGDSAPLLAYIEVFLDKSTPSGFAWWGGAGPPYAVTRGTRVAVDVVVERDRPITLVMPALRKLLGLEG